MNIQKDWTVPQKILLEKMKKADASWPEIALATGHSIDSCKWKLSKLRCERRDDPSRLMREAADAADIALSRKRWKTDDINQLLEMKAQRRPMLSHGEIGEHFGVSPKAVTAQVDRLRKEGVKVGFATCLPDSEPKPGRPKKDDLGALKIIIPDPPYSRTNTSTAKFSLEAELIARIRMLGITGGMLGDPLPGRGALTEERDAAWCGGSASISSTSDFRP